MTTGTIIAIIFGIIGIIMIFVGSAKFLEVGPTILTTFLLIGGPLIGIIPTIINLESQRQNELEEAYALIDSGAKVYIDGQETDPDKIFLENYKIEFKGKDVILWN